MECLVRKKKSRAVLCYDESHMDGNNDVVNGVRDALRETEITFVDIHVDGTSGRPQWAEIGEVVLDTVWVVIICTAQLMETGEADLIQRIVTDSSRRKRLQNVIVLGHTNILPLVPHSLSCISLVLDVDHGNWTKALTSAITSNPKALISSDECENPDHLDLKALAVDKCGHMSDPGVVSSNEDEVIPVKVKKITKTLAKRRMHQVARLPKEPTFVHLFTVDETNLHLILQNWMWQVGIMAGCVSPIDEISDYDITIDLESLELQERVCGLEVTLSDCMFHTNEYGLLQHLYAPIRKEQVQLLEDDINQAALSKVKKNVTLCKKSVDHILNNDNINRTFKGLKPWDSWKVKVLMTYMLKLEGIVEGCITDKDKHKLINVQLDVGKLFQNLNLVQCQDLKIKRTSVFCSSSMQFDFLALADQRARWNRGFSLRLAYLRSSSHIGNNVLDLTKSILHRLFCNVVG